MLALQTCSTARASCIRAVIPLKSSPQQMRMSACYWGHLIMIIVSIFSCSPKVAAFINVPKRRPASFSGAMSTVTLEGCVLPLPASRDPLREERWATGCSATTSCGAGDWDAEEEAQEPGAWQDHAAFWQSRMEGIRQPGQELGCPGSGTTLAAQPPTLVVFLLPPVSRTQPSLAGNGNVPTKSQPTAIGSLSYVGPFKILADKFCQVVETYSK